MKLITYKCEECKTEISENDNRLIYNENKNRKTLCFEPWPSPPEETGEEKHLCGPACAGKVLQRHLESLHA